MESLPSGAMNGTEMVPRSRQGSERAALRWNMLKKFLLKKETPRQSVTRCISTFGLLNQAQADGKLQDESGTNYQAFSFSMPHEELPLSIDLRLKVETTMKDLEIADKDSVDNTGNVCVWPSEEILAYHCIHKLGEDFFRNKRVLELGCGVGVAGLLLAKAFPSIQKIVLTDGNASVVENLQYNIDRLCEKGELGKHISCAQLLWQDNEGITDRFGEFDIVIAADCLFFETFHNDLISLIRKVCEGRPNSVVMFNPKRGKSLDNFLNLLSQSTLAVAEVNENYNERVFQKNLEYEMEYSFYSKENHYPLLLQITF